jgi:3-oxoacyl-[acyl-carrier-protein] synthase II
MGLVTALGVGVDRTWSRMIAGDSGLGRISRFDTNGFANTFAGEVTDVEPGELDRFVEFARIAAQEAIAQSGAEVSGAAVLMGTAFGGVESLAGRKFDRWFPWLAADAVAAESGAAGPVITYQASFTGSANAIGEGADWIRQGRVDIAIAGGSDAAITPVIIAGFISMGATSHNTGDPKLAVKPFAGDRDGCSIGEGSAALVLEERDRAIGRGATILAELAGYGTTADAFHVVALPEDGDAIVRAMLLALDQARLSPRDIGYINAHGTGTAMNDAVETTAMKRVFTGAAGTIPISSTKPATGHLLGAAGALEAIIGIQALRTGVAPPTLNLSVPDPQCDLDYVPLVSRHVDPDAVMSNSMGFGGHATSLVFRRG